MDVTAADWGVLLGIVLVLFTVDLLVATLRPHAVGFREAALWSVFFVAAAAGFGAVLSNLEGWGSPACSTGWCTSRRAWR